MDLKYYLLLFKFCLLFNSNKRWRSRSSGIFNIYLLVERLGHFVLENLEKVPLTPFHSMIFKELGKRPMMLRLSPHACKLRIFLQVSDKFDSLVISVRVK